MHGTPNAMRYLEKNTTMAAKLTGRADSLDTPAASIVHKKIYVGNERCARSTAAIAQEPKRHETGTKRLKYEFRRLGETRQRGGRGVEHRTATEIGFGAAIKHGLALRAAPKHANEPAAVFELIEQRRRDHLG